MNKLAASILDFNNSLQNTSFPVHERVLAIPLPYYMHWFKNITPMFLSIFMTVNFVSNV